MIEPTVFKDERGYFVETYNQNDFREAGLNMVFVQDNQSMSVKGVLRGLHFQKQYPQGKLVRAWCSRIKRSSHTNARTSIIPAMKAALSGTILKSGLTGRYQRAWN